jgi:ELWxxDGT repeat protein
VTSGAEVFFVAGPTEAPALWRSDGTPEGTKPVRSFPAPATYPRDIVAVGARIFFVVSEPATGYEIWVSDGSEEGTKLFADLRLGPDSLGAQHLTAVGDELFFSAYDSEHGNELWHSDGTPEGTGLVRDIIPGPDGPFGAVELCVCACKGSSFAVSGSAVFFAVGDQLWTSDGTFDGTKLLRDFDISPRPIFVTSSSDRVYVASDPTDAHPFLWSSDGSVEGTVELGRLAVKELAPAGEQVFFSGNDGRTGFELWRTDGTVEGTALVEDLFSGPGSSNPLQLTAVDDRVFFVADDGEHGFELWSSDGTEAGTRLIKDIWPGLDSSLNTCRYGWCPSEILVGNGVVFVAAADASGSIGLWRSDGTEEGTAKVVDLGTVAPGDLFARVQAVGDDLYFTTWNVGGLRLRLWHWGAAGVGLVKEWAAAYPFHRLFLFEGALHFEGPGGIWRTDGTPEGTVPAFGAGLEMGDFLAAGPRFIFGSAADVWLGDGTADGTHLLKASTGVASEFTRAAERVYFSAGVARRELWGSDFTTAGTATIKEIDPLFGSDPRDIAAADGAAVFFTAHTQAQGRELWYSDGSVGGTTLVRDIRAGDEASFDEVHDPSGAIILARRLVAAGRTAVFRADDGASGGELWWGQADWASRLQDIAPGTASSQPYGFTLAAGRIFFSADDGSHGRELWAVPLTALETPCASDCGGDGHVTIEELVAAVRIAAVIPGAEPCTAADVDGDGRVVTGEIKSAVRRALAGC